MISNKTQTLRLTATEVDDINRASIILYDLITSIRDDDTVEINNSEWDCENLNVCYSLLDDLCKQGISPMVVTQE